jgi:hypothetical protein
MDADSGNSDTKQVGKQKIICFCQVIKIPSFALSDHMINHKMCQLPWETTK